MHILFQTLQQKAVQIKAAKMIIAKVLLVIRDKLKVAKKRAFQKDTCGDSCSNCFTKKISLEQRIELHRIYWEKDNKQQQDYLAEHVSLQEKKTTTCATTVRNQKHNRVYTLKNKFGVVTQLVNSH